MRRSNDPAGDPESVNYPPDKSVGSDMICPVCIPSEQLPMPYISMVCLDYFHIRIQGLQVYPGYREGFFINISCFVQQNQIGHGYLPVYFLLLPERLFEIQGIYKTDNTVHHK